MAARATQSGGGSPMSLPLSMWGLFIGMHHGKTKVCQWTLPSPCLDYRWALRGEEALLLGQVLAQLLGCRHRGPMWLPSRCVWASQISPFPAWPHSWIQDGDYCCGVPQKEETQELLSSLLHDWFCVYELETLDIQCNIHHRLQIMWAAPASSSE